MKIFCQESEKKEAYSLERYFHASYVSCSCKTLFRPLQKNQILVSNSKKMSSSIKKEDISFYSLTITYWKLNRNYLPVFQAKIWGKGLEEISKTSFFIKQTEYLQFFSNWPFAITDPQKWSISHESASEYRSL